MAYNHTGSASSRELKRANPSTIQDKFMVGYQGWFTCAEDGQPLDPHHHGWLHWITEPLDVGGRPNTDLWPDLTAYDEDELYPVPGLHMQSGEQARLFSSRHPKTVRRHFHWMAEHGVDGVFLQRFVGQCDVEGNSNIRDQRDEVGRRVREAAEAEGRVWAIMYDVSGVPADRIERVIKEDWMHLIHNQRILDSPSYLKEKGRPVLAIWGLGFSDRDYTIHQVREIYSFVRNQTPGGVYTVAGVPAHWRTSTGDAVEDPDFVQFFLNEPDALSPWTIGRYGDEDGADNFAEEKIKGDMEAIKKQNEENDRRHGEGAKRLDYMPVVFPGGSGFNLSEGKWGFNDIKRNGGRFLWRQVWNAKRQGVRIMYGAMWDEYDEGTAFLPVVSHKRLLPKCDKWPFLSLDEEGHDLPSDWYMRIAGFAAEGLRSERMVHETFPVKELQDYWATRPRYEEPAASGSGSASAPGSGPGSQSMQAWEATQAKPDVDEPPPPPYTLEAGEAAAASAPAPAPSQPRQDPIADLTASMAGASIAPGPPQQQPIQGPSQGSGNTHRQSSGYQQPVAPTAPAQPPQTQSGAPWAPPAGPPPGGSPHQSSYGPSPGGTPYGMPQGPSGSTYISNSPPVTSPQSTVPPWGQQYGGPDPKQQAYAPPAGPPHVSPQRTGSYPSPTQSTYGYSNATQGQYPPASWDMKQSIDGSVYPQHSGSSMGGYNPGYQSTSYGAPQQPYGAPGPGQGPSSFSPSYGHQGAYAGPVHQSSMGPAGYPAHSPAPPQQPYNPYPAGSGGYNHNNPYFPTNSPPPSQPHAPYGVPGGVASPAPHQAYAPYGGASTSPVPGTPPALPARPTSQSSGSYSQGYTQGPSNPYAGSSPASGSGSGAAGRPLAMGLDSLGTTVERFGGKNVRKHFDRGVKELDGVVNTGNKLLSRFMK